MPDTGLRIWCSWAPPVLSSPYLFFSYLPLPNNAFPCLILQLHCLAVQVTASGMNAGSVQELPQLRPTSLGVSSTAHNGIYFMCTLMVLSVTRILRERKRETINRRYTRRRPLWVRTILIMLSCLLTELCLRREKNYKQNITWAFWDVGVYTECSLLSNE